MTSQHKNVESFLKYVQKEMDKQRNHVDKITVFSSLVANTSCVVLSCAPFFLVLLLCGFAGQDHWVKLSQERQLTNLERLKMHALGMDGEVQLNENEFGAPDESDNTTEKYWLTVGREGHAFGIVKRCWASSEDNGVLEFHYVPNPNDGCP